MHNRQSGIAVPYRFGLEQSLEREVQLQFEVVQEPGSVVALLRLLALFGDRHGLGIGHAETEAVTEDLFVCPG